MELRSSDFEDGGEILKKFTCNGGNIRPNLAWSELPPNTKSLAVSMIDPDAPNGRFIHWLVVNISISTTEIRSEETVGLELPNSIGKTEYVSPCPPSGKHHYVFTLYALDADRLGSTEVESFFSEIKAHLIDQATLTGEYGKS